MVRPGNKRLRFAQNTNHGAGVNKDGRLPSIGRPINIMKVTNNCHLCPYNFIFRKIFFDNIEYYDNGLEIKVLGVNNGMGTGYNEQNVQIETRLKPIDNTAADTHVFSGSGNLTDRSVLIDFYNRMHLNNAITAAINATTGTPIEKMKEGVKQMESTTTAGEKHSKEILVWFQKQLYNFIWKKAFIRRWQLMLDNDREDNKVFSKDLKMDDIKLTNAIKTLNTKVIQGGAAITNYMYITKAEVDLRMSVKIDDKKTDHFESLFRADNDGPILSAETNKPENMKLDGDLRVQISGVLNAFSQGSDNFARPDKGYWFDYIRYITNALFKTGQGSITTNDQKAILKQEFNSYISKIINEEKIAIPYTTGTTGDFQDKFKSGTAAAETTFGILGDTIWGNTAASKITTLQTIMINIYTDKLWIIEGQAANGGINGSVNYDFIAQGGDIKTSSNSFYPLYNILDKRSLLHRDFKNESTAIKDEIIPKWEKMNKYRSKGTIKSSLYIKLKRSGQSQATPAAARISEEQQALQVQQRVSSFNLFNSNTLNRSFINMNTIKKREIITTSEGAQINMVLDGQYDVDVNNFNLSGHQKRWNSLETYQQNDIKNRAQNFANNLLMFDLNGDKLLSFSSDSITSDLGVLYLALLNKDDPEFIKRKPEPKFILNSNGSVNESSVIFQKTQKDLLSLRDELFKIKYTAYAEVIPTKNNPKKQKFSMTIYICKGLDNTWHVKAGGNNASRLKYLHMEFIDNETRQAIDIASINLKMNSAIGDDLYHTTITQKSNSIVFWKGLKTLGQDQTPSDIASFQYNGKGTPIFTNNTRIIFQYTMNPLAPNPLYLDATRPQKNWLENYPVDTLFNDFTLRTGDFEKETTDMIVNSCKLFYFGNFSNVNEKGVKEDIPTVNMNDFNEALLFNETEVKRHQTRSNSRNQIIVRELLTRFMDTHTKIAKASQISYPLVNNFLWDGKDTISFDSSRNLLTTVISIPKEHWPEWKDDIKTKYKHPKFPDETNDILKKIAESIEGGSVQSTPPKKNFHLSVKLKEKTENKLNAVEEKYATYKIEISPEITNSSSGNPPTNFWWKDYSIGIDTDSTDFYKPPGSTKAEYKTIIILTRPTFDASKNITNNYTETTIDYFPKGENQYHTYLGANELFLKLNADYFSKINGLIVDFCVPKDVKYADDIINNAYKEIPEARREERLKTAITELNIAQLKKDSNMCEKLKVWIAKMEKILGPNAGWKISSSLDTVVSKLTLENFLGGTQEIWDKLNDELNILLKEAVDNGYPQTGKGYYSILKTVNTKLKEQKQTLLGNTDQSKTLSEKINSIKDKIGSEDVDRQATNTMDILIENYNPDSNNTYIIINNLKINLSNNVNAYEKLFNTEINELKTDLTELQNNLNENNKDYINSQTITNTEKLIQQLSVNYIPLAAINEYIEQNKNIELANVLNKPTNSLNLLPKTIEGEILTKLGVHATVRQKNKLIENVLDEYDSSLNKLEIKTAETGIDNMLATFANQSFGNENYPISFNLTPPEGFTGNDLNEAITYKNEIVNNISKLDETLKVGGSIIKGTLNYNYETYDNLDNVWVNEIKDYGQVKTFFDMMEFRNSTLKGSENKSAYNKIKKEILNYDIGNILSAGGDTNQTLIDKIEVLSHAKQLDTIGNEIDDLVINSLNTQTITDINNLDILNHTNILWKNDYNTVDDILVIEANIDLSLNELIEKYDDLYTNIDATVNKVAPNLNEIYHLLENNSINYDPLPPRFEHLNKGKKLRKLIQYLRVHNILSIHDVNHISELPVNATEKILLETFNKAKTYDIPSSTVQSDNLTNLESMVNVADMQMNLKNEYDKVKNYNWQNLDASEDVNVNDLYSKTTIELNKFLNFDSNAWSPEKIEFANINTESVSPIEWNVKRVRTIQAKIQEKENELNKNTALIAASTNIQIFETKSNTFKNDYNMIITGAPQLIVKKDIVGTAFEDGVDEKTYSVTTTYPPPESATLEFINDEINSTLGIKDYMNRVKSVSYFGKSIDKNIYGPAISTRVSLKAYTKPLLNDIDNFIKIWNGDDAAPADSPENKGLYETLKEKRDELEAAKVPPAPQESPEIVASRTTLETAKQTVTNAQKDFDSAKKARDDAVKAAENVDANLVKIQGDIVAKNGELETATNSVTAQQTIVDNLTTELTPIKNENDRIKKAIADATTSKNNANAILDGPAGGQSLDQRITAAEAAVADTNNAIPTLQGIELENAQGLLVQQEQTALDLNDTKTTQEGIIVAQDVILALEQLKEVQSDADLSTKTDQLNPQVIALNNNKSLVSRLTTEKENLIQQETAQNELNAAKQNAETALNAEQSKLNTAKENRDTAQNALDALLPNQPVVPQTPTNDRLIIELPFDMNKELRANLTYQTIDNNEAAKIQRFYRYTMDDPNSPNIKFDTDHHLGMDQKYDAIFNNDDYRDISMSNIELAERLKLYTNDHTWYDMLNKKYIGAIDTTTNLNVPKAIIHEKQSSIKNWVTIGLENVNNTTKSADIYIQINSDLSNGSDEDVTETTDTNGNPIIGSGKKGITRNEGEIKSTRIGIDSVNISFINSSGPLIEIKNTNFNLKAGQIILADDDVPTFDPKGWWTRNDAKMIGRDGSKIVIGSVKFQNLAQNKNIDYELFEDLNFGCGGNTSGLRYTIKYSKDGFSNRIFFPRKHHIRKINLNVLKNRGIMEEGYDITGLLGDYDGDGIPVTPQDSEEFYSAISFKLDENMLPFLANPSKNEVVYNNIVKVLGIKKKRLFFTPYLDKDGNLVKNMDGTNKLKIHPDCKYGVELNRALNKIVPKKKEEIWTEIDRLEFAVPENLTTEKKKIFFIMQKSNLPEDNPNKVRIFISGEEKEIIIKDENGNITDKGFVDTEKFYGAQFYLNQKIRENTYLFKDSLSKDQDSSIKEINDTGKFGDKTQVNETSVAFVKFKNNIGYNFAGILGEFKLNDNKKIDELRFIKQKSIATFRSNDLTEAAPAFGKTYPIGTVKRYLLENGSVDLVVTDSHHAAVILNNNNNTTSFELNIFDEKTRGARLGQCTLTGDKDQDLKEVQKIINNKELINPELLPSTSVLKEDLVDNPNGGFRMIATCLKDNVTFSKSVYCGIIRISSSKSKVAPDINDLKITSSNV